MLYFSNWKTFSILAVIIVGIICAAPNVFTKKQAESLPTWLPHKQINLGLDLQGGSHLVLKMNTDELLQTQLKSIRDGVNQNLRELRIDGKIVKRSRPKIINGQIQVRISKPEHVAPALTKLRELIQPLEFSILAGTSNNNIEITQGENNTIIIQPTQAAIVDRLRGAMGSAVEVMRRRVDPNGTTEPIIQQQGKDRIIVQVPGVDDPAELKRILGKTARLTFQLVDPRGAQLQGGSSRRAPPGTEWVPSEQGPPELLKAKAIVSGEELEQANATNDQQTNEPVVSFRFNSTGSRNFGRVTQENVGRPFAIVLDNGFVSETDENGNVVLDKDGKPKLRRDRRIISAPVIQEPILGGVGQISGSFTPQQTQDLALLLNSGSLAASMEIIEERSVGPSLGEDSIVAGQIAGIIGLVAVIAFILFTYGLFGLFANVALIVNIALIVGLLSLTQATLTLPGIAGIVLTIGMAVDANVLIYERIREEIRAGKSTISAIETGYNRASSTILDANITTLIAAIVLYFLGSGPISGFAVTLAFGIMTSVFTSFVFTRFIISFWLRMQRTRTIEIPI
ncbi:MAG: protein translocase subunit SecD [Pseudomonadota bacterium]